MDYRFVIRQLGLLFVVLGGCMVVALVSAIADVLRGIIEDRETAIALFASICICWVAGGIAYFSGRTTPSGLGRREALLLVALSWILGAGAAALPFYFWANLSTPEPAGPFSQFVNCYFEAMSGLTTTGASVLSDIEAVPPALLFWRALTHWLGGLGIVVLFVAVFPTLGVGGKRLFRIEAPGPTPQGVRPRIRETARVLWVIYLTLTVAETLILKIMGMSWFDALCHTFATLATGGFSTKNGSVGQFDSLACEMVILCFMILAGINFGLYFHLAHGKWSSILQDRELRLYLAIQVVASVLVIGSIHNRPITTMTGDVAEPSLAHATRYGVFQVVSLQTTTGFGTAEFDHWPFLAKCTLLVLMFIGGSAGSTGGGIKVIRIMAAAKIMWAELERVFRPNVIRTIRVGRAPIDQDLRLGTLMYICTILLLFAIGAIGIMLLEPAEKIDIVTAATASAATLNNIGPGLGEVSATANYGHFSAPSKGLMSLLMLLGRLEVFAVVVLFMPKFWRGQ